MIGDIGTFFFYWYSGGPDFGARYWYLILVPLVVLSVRGLQALQGSLLELMRSIGDPYGLVANMAGRPIDHMPMMEEDWPWLGWALDEVSAGRWKSPWVVSFEYGGVGIFWEALTRREVYLEQLPRMAGMVRAAAQKLEV